MADLSAPAAEPCLLARMLVDLPSADAAARSAVTARAREVLRPSGAFARLDEVAAWLAGWQRTHQPAVKRPAVLVFAADHGVAVEGVSAYPTEVTAAMVDAVKSGVATVTAIARQVGAAVRVVDVGVGRPTGNIRTCDAMSDDDFDEAVAAGAAAAVHAVEVGQADLLLLGELGIANTTSASALCMALFTDPPDTSDDEAHTADTSDDVARAAARAWVGPGTGVSGAALSRKRDVVSDAVCRVGSVTPLEALRRLGGRELAAIAGAVVAARQRSVPVVLDGFIGTAAVAPLHAAMPGSLDHAIAGHCSAEPGHRQLLERLELEPVLQLDLGLGEGSGGLAAVPIIAIAAAAVTGVATFSEQGLASGSL